MVMKLKIKDICQENRPREKMIINGPENMSNEELLAIILSTGTKDKSALELALEIINGAGNIKRLFNMSLSDLMRINGIKEAKACSILASLELSKRAMSYKESNEIFDKASKFISYLRPLMIMDRTEVIYVLLLDSKLHLIKSLRFSFGSSWESYIPKRKIIAEAIKFNTRFMVLSHNHPSGDPLPSKSDIDITYNLMRQLEIVGIKLLDHLIIASDNCYSFLDEGLL